MSGSVPITQVAECTDTNAVLSALSNKSASTVNVGNAGTAMRFLTAYFAACEGHQVTIDGDARMRQRPIGPLVDALRACGADIEYQGIEGFPPLLISGRQLHGGNVAMDASVSSQFVSALLMVAPEMTDGLHLTLGGEITSAPYIDMTLELMRQAGAEAERSGAVIDVHNGNYSRLLSGVEADWSAASYWYEIAALTSGFVTLCGIGSESVQGDRVVADIFENLGVVTDFHGEEAGCVELAASPELMARISMDMSSNPDLAQTMAVTCAMIGIPFSLTGLSTLRIKETDRLAALGAELQKVGVNTEITTDSIAWDGRRMPIVVMPEFDTYGDHRMAMAFAPVSVYIPGIVVRDVEVVEKSYPDFWHHLAEAGFTLAEVDPSAPEEGEES